MRLRNLNRKLRSQSQATSWWLTVSCLEAAEKAAFSFDVNRFVHKAASKRELPSATNLKSAKGGQQFSELECVELAAGT
jgi:hypothetical protein